MLKHTTAAILLVLGAGCATQPEQAESTPAPVAATTPSTTETSHPPPSESTETTVPIVTGLQLDSAREKAKAAGLTLTVSPGDPADDDHEPGMVQSQDPAGGTVVDPGSAIAVTVWQVADTESGETAESRVLEVAVTDWTENNPPGERAEIWVRGHGSWFLDLEFGGDGPQRLGEFPVGQVRSGDFYVYPDGRDGGVEIAVTFEMTSDMTSGSDRSRTHVEIYDDHVLVWGEAIPDFEQRHER